MLVGARDEVTEGLGLPLPLLQRPGAKTARTLLFGWEHLPMIAY